MLFEYKPGLYINPDHIVTVDFTYPPNAYATLSSGDRITFTAEEFSRICAAARLAHPVKPSTPRRKKKS